MSHRLLAARYYVNEQFPPVQAVALGVGCGVEYLAFGRMSGHISVAMLTVIAAITVPLLFLQLRLLDDIHTFYDSKGTGDIGGATVRGLVWGLVVTTVVVIAVNATHSRTLIWTVAIITLMLASSGVLRMGKALPGWARLILGRLPLFELAPALMLAYVYVTWSTATRNVVPVGDVAVVVGLFWAAFNVWKFSRHMGELPHERIYRLNWPAIRVICLLLIGLCAICSIILFQHAHLSVLFFMYALGLCAVFAVLSRPRHIPDIERPAWVGLPFPVLLLAGLLVQLLLLA